MSNRSLRSQNGGTAIPEPLLDALGTVNTWHPLLISMTKTNGHVAEGFGMLFSEWQNFVGLRVQQDLLLWRKLAECTSSHDVATAYTHFWQKAAADYWLEKPKP